jgi:hypothetical protein
MDEIRSDCEYIFILGYNILDYNNLGYNALSNAGIVPQTTRIAFQ